jgi:hypothetical protein
MHKLLLVASAALFFTACSITQAPQLKLFVIQPANLILSILRERTGLPLL